MEVTSDQDGGSDEENPSGDTAATKIPPIMVVM
jgi:hypothetical protein